MKKALAVIVGYLIFALSAVIYFQLTGEEPNAIPTATFTVLTSLYGILFSFAGGFVLQMIAKTGSLRLNYILALIIAGLAFVSLLMTKGNHWTQTITILVFAPTSILGGYHRRKRNG